MDNGKPWGSGAKTPTAMGLWLVGLGIDLSYSRPARSTDNAVVERSHGVLDNWVETDTCVDFTSCHQQLAWAVHTQRERYRLHTGQTRIQQHPDLHANPRGYDPQMDSQMWSRYRVRQYLSGFSFQRKVEKNGRITLLGNAYYLSREYARRTVEVHFDEATEHWVICDEFGKEIRRHLAKELCYEAISQMSLSQPTMSRRHSVKAVSQ